jgi:dsDNA-specific endonuclease/ATPase MutS2
MDEHTYRVLEFFKVLQMCAVFAVTGPGRIVVSTIRPLGTIEEIRQRIATVSECGRLVSDGRQLGLEHFEDLSPLFQRLRPSDAVLGPVELRSFLPFLYSALNLKVLSNDPSYPGIGSIVSRLSTHREIMKAVESSIDREGKVRGLMKRKSGGYWKAY